MRFLQIINQKKFTLISIFLFLYLLFNLFDGERGLISFYEKQEIKNEMLLKKISLQEKLISMEKKIDLLSNNINLDYLEILYRDKFLVGKSGEKIYLNIKK